jgi:hypothetical protein
MFVLFVETSGRVNTVVLADVGACAGKAGGENQKSNN